MARCPQPPRLPLALWSRAWAAFEVPPKQLEVSPVCLYPPACPVGEDHCLTSCLPAWSL